MAFSLTAIVNKYKESHPDVKEWVEFTAGEGTRQKTFRYHHPIYMTNEEGRRLARIQADPDASTSDLVRGFLGDDQYEEFAKAGGQDTAVLMLVQLVQERDLPDMSVKDAEGK
ncbi:hypothetical protein [Bifidobacterium sp.]|uniref:hypothetical protein n=1 Tax=Bifidobacterium sp. TaxID=41200 RepID=UPI0039EA9A4B